MRCQGGVFIVDATPGTTRLRRVTSEWDGIPVTLIDTAGERSDKSELEEQGLRLGQRRYSGTDLALIVVDGKRGLGPDEESLISSLPGTCRTLWCGTRPSGGLSAVPGE